MVTGSADPSLALKQINEQRAHHLYEVGETIQELIEKKCTEKKIVLFHQFYSQVTKKRTRSMSSSSS